MTQFLRDQASDSEEVDTPLMLDGTYLSRNFATLEPLTYSRHMFSFSVWRLVNVLKVAIPMTVIPSLSPNVFLTHGLSVAHFHMPALRPLMSDCKKGPW